MNQLSTAQQKRILRLMLNGDLIWEVAGKSYRSIYNERLSHQQRVPASAIEEMEQQGWIRRLDNPNSSRLDGWEMTEQGRAFAAQLRTRRQAKPEASSLSESLPRGWRDAQAHVEPEDDHITGFELMRITGKVFASALARTMH